MAGQVGLVNVLAVERLPDTPTRHKADITDSRNAGPEGDDGLHAGEVAGIPGDAIGIEQEGKAQAQAKLPETDMPPAPFVLFLVFFLVILRLFGRFRDAEQSQNTKPQKQEPGCHR